LFTPVSDAISATRKTAVSSASVRSVIAVESSVITFLVTFGNSITAKGSGLQKFDGSTVGWLKASVVSSDNSSKLIQLVLGESRRSGEDEPFGSLGARRSIERTRVVVSSWSGRKDGLRINRDVEPDGLSADVGSTLG